MPASYSSPTISDYSGPLLNEVEFNWKGHSMVFVDGVSVSALLDKYGSPLFIFSEQKRSLTIAEAPLLQPNVDNSIVLHTVDAQNVTQRMQFLKMRPAVVFISKNGDINLIQNRGN